MPTLSDRVSNCITEFAQRNNLKESTVISMLATATGIKAPSVYDWIKGKTKHLQGGNLNRAAAFFDVEAAWLDTGDGIKRQTSDLGVEQVGNSEKSLTTGSGKAALYNAREPSISIDRYLYVPVYNVKGAMGNGSSYTHEEVKGKHSYSQAWLIEEGLDVKNLVRMKGEGDSMIPTIADGDTLLINLAEKKIAGRVYAFRVGDEIRVKRLIRTMDGRVRVISDNPDKQLYPDEYLSIDDQPEVIGRVRDRSGKNGL